VIIVGAGLSGIGAAHHLNEQCPGTSFVVLETKSAVGGTWLTHHYPGSRSDSDLYTYGYRFRPWIDAPIADREKILRYLGDVVREEGLERHIRFGLTVTTANWSSEDGRWTLDVAREGTGERLRLRARFLWMCQGYYRHAEGYTPQWPGMGEFNGRVVHPQNWPDDLDYAGRRVVVIGSGATAATLIPAIAPACAHLTMLQRSPTYYFIRSNVNELADTLRDLDTPEAWVHEIVRRKILFDFAQLTELALAFPDLAREELLRPIREILGDDYDVDTHFGPRYPPWRQRIAMVLEGDLFEQIREGQVSVVTDEIERFCEDGLVLKSGETLGADIVITATGFEMNVLGDIDFSVDGVALDFATTVTYRGIMFTGVPNLVEVFGYFRASWTLRVDLIADFTCRLLQHMRDLGATVVMPQLRPEDADMELRPWVDPADFNPGYLARGVHLLPRQGDRDPWRNGLSYWVEKETLPRADLDDGTLGFR